MQPGVERERLLKIQAVKTSGLERVENQVPAARGDGAGNRHEAMATKKIIAKGLLARARNPPVAASWGLARRCVRRCGSEAVRAHTWPCKHAVALVRIRRA